MAGVYNAALWRVCLVFTSTVPDAPNNKHRITFIHFACRAEGSVGGTGDRGLGPLVGANNDLRRAVFKVGILK